MASNESFATRLNRALKYRGLRPADLARSLGLANGTIANYLTGKNVPRPKRLTQIAKAMNVTEAWLQGYGDNQVGGNEYYTDASDVMNTASVDAMVESLLSSLTPTSNGTLMLDGKPATPEAVELFKQALRLDIEYAIRKNEETLKNEKSDSGSE